MCFAVLHALPQCLTPPFTPYLHLSPSLEPSGSIGPLLENIQDCDFLSFRLSQNLTKSTYIFSVCLKLDFCFYIFSWRRLKV